MAGLAQEKVESILWYASARKNVNRGGWQEISQRFTDDGECLASFLALEGAEVIQGVKPANLVSIANKRRPCGRNLYQLWKRHGAALLEQSDLQAWELADRGDSVLLLFYNAELLTSLLATKSAATVLEKAGYRNPGHLWQALGELRSRFQSVGFPHEIGVFLGYPLKDVVGFLGWAPLTFTCQGPWKIFGDPRKSLELAQTHRECRCRMSQRLGAGCNPHDCLRSTTLSRSKMVKKVPELPIH